VSGWSEARDRVLHSGEDLRLAWEHLHEDVDNGRDSTVNLERTHEAMRELVASVDALDQAEEQVITLQESGE
jgi:hypothetical protein